LHRFDELREPLIPLLESKNEAELYEVRGWLANIDWFFCPDLESKLTEYRAPLLRQKASPPPGLVKYLFDMRPGRALLLFGDIYLGDKGKPGDASRDLVWADHLISTVTWRIFNGFVQEGDLEKARKEVDRLSKHDGWYARRYVIEVIRAEPKLGTPEIVDRLKKDPHPLVAEAVKHIGEPRRVPRTRRP
jgi:hypothetical protein